MHFVNRQLFANEELMLSKARIICGTSLGNLCTEVCHPVQYCHNWNSAFLGNSLKSQE